MGKQIEGPSVAGVKVLAVEDTSTTGGSPLAAVEALLKVGAEIAAPEQALASLDPAGMRDLGEQGVLGQGQRRRTRIVDVSLTSDCLRN